DRWRRSATTKGLCSGSLKAPVTAQLPAFGESFCALASPASGKPPKPPAATAAKPAKPPRPESFPPKPPAATVIPPKPPAATATPPAPTAAPPKPPFATVSPPNPPVCASPLPASVDVGDPELPHAGTTLVAHSVPKINFGTKRARLSCRPRFFIHGG